MYPKSNTDFFLAYSYKGSPLEIVDSPREWRIGSSYEICEFEGGSDFVCHPAGQRNLGLVRMLVPYGQPDTTMTFRYRIQAAGCDSRGNFEIVLSAT
jgi:hypothetical protein